MEPRNQVNGKTIDRGTQAFKAQIDLATIKNAGEFKLLHRTASQIAKGGKA